MRGALPVLATVALLALAGAAQAAPADKHIEMEADDGDGCLQEAKNDCFRVVNGTSLDGIEQGMLVHVVLENVGDSPHNVHVTESTNADDNNIDTSADDAINASDTVDPGETTDLMFAVPADGEGLYFWCDVGTHEATGMWLETDVAEPEDPGAGDEDGNETGEQANETAGEDEEEDSGDDVGRFLPAPGPVATIAATLAGVLAVRRRS